MTRRPATWKIVTFGAALTGLGVAGAGLAAADDDRPGSVPAGLTVAAPDAHDSPDTAQAAPAPVDASPESADSPAESAWDSADVGDADVQSANSPDTGSADSPDGV